MDSEYNILYLNFMHIYIWVICQHFIVTSKMFLSKILNEFQDKVGMFTSLLKKILCGWLFEPDYNYLSFLDRKVS